MKKSKVISLMMTVCVLTICVLPFGFNYTKSENSSITEFSVEEAQHNNVVPVAEEEAEIEESPVLNSKAEELSEQEIVEYLTGMLNINNCFNSAFESNKSLAYCASASLADYASDIEGYGLCVNNCLVESFVKSFYGTEICTSEIENNGEAPDGYTPIVDLNLGSFYHTPVSIEKTNDGYIFLTSATFYDGGSDTDSILAKSHFTVDPYSEFGFNLISCELL